jgi:hypothetical protein
LLEWKKNSESSASPGGRVEGDGSVMVLDNFPADGQAGVGSTFRGFLAQQFKNTLRIGELKAAGVIGNEELSEIDVAIFSGDLLKTIVLHQGALDRNGGMLFRTTSDGIAQEDFKKSDELLRKTFDDRQRVGGEVYGLSCAGGDRSQGDLQDVVEVDGSWLFELSIDGEIILNNAQEVIDTSAGGVNTGESGFACRVQSLLSFLAKEIGKGADFTNWFPEVMGENLADAPEFGIAALKFSQVAIEFVGMFLELELSLAELLIITESLLSLLFCQEDFVFIFAPLVDGHKSAADSP